MGLRRADEIILRTSIPPFSQRRFDAYIYVELVLKIGSDVFSPSSGQPAIVFLTGHLVRITCNHNARLGVCLEEYLQFYPAFHNIRDKRLSCPYLEGMCSWGSSFSQGGSRSWSNWRPPVTRMKPLSSCYPYRRQPPGNLTPRCFPAVLTRRRAQQKGEKRNRFVFKDAMWYLYNLIFCSGGFPGGRV